jgi:hypothetical protein
VGSFSIGGFTAKAKTVKAAREIVDKKIRSFRDLVKKGTYCPVFVNAITHAVVIWRQPEEGWTYRIIELTSLKALPTLLDSEILIGNTAFAGWDRDGCERAARKHLAQNLYSWESHATGEHVILNETDRHEHLWWVGWQDRYHKAKAAGASDNYAREVADNEKPMLEDCSKELAEGDYVEYKVTAGGIIEICFGSISKIDLAADEIVVKRDGGDMADVVKRADCRKIKGKL